MLRFLAHAILAYIVFFLAVLFLIYGTGLASWEGSGGKLDEFAQNQEWVIYLSGLLVALVVASVLDRRRARSR